MLEIKFLSTLQRIRTLKFVDKVNPFFLCPSYFINNTNIIYFKSWTINKIICINYLPTSVANMDGNQCISLDKSSLFYRRFFPK